MKSQSFNSPTTLKRLIAVTRGRPLAVLFLLTIVLVEIFHNLPAPQKGTLPTGLISSVEAVRSPITGVRNWLFDAYQKLSPREPQSQPVTIIAIDEKSLAAFGQWPWPRDILANIINTIDMYGPAAIGLDIYMPEPDQNSLENLFRRLAPEQKSLIDEIISLPSTDFELSMSLSSTPSVLGAAGFDFDAYTTSKVLNTIELSILGEDPLPYIHNYPEVLASIPELQEAAAGQALLSIPSEAGAVRQVPLVSAVSDKLVPGLAMELLRVATRESSITIDSSKLGVERVGVADLEVPTQSDASVWLRYASIDSTKHRYLSALDLLNGDFDPSLLQSKLVLIGLTGAGLSDMRFTALGELVPGIEIQAQLLESIFDGGLLERPKWMPLIELALVVSAGLLLIWYVPRPDSRIGALLKYHPGVVLAVCAALALLFTLIGYLLFSIQNTLFAASSVVIGITSILGIFFVNAVLENLSDARAKLARLVESGIALGRIHQREPLLDMTAKSIMEIAPAEALLVFVRNESGELQPVRQQGLSVPWLDPVDPSEGRYAQSLFAQLATQSVPQRLALDQALSSVGAEQYLASIKTISNNPVKSLVAVPLLRADSTAAGAVVLINSLNTMTGVIEDFDDRSVQFIEALSTQAAVALENQELVQAQTNMMDAMIKMIAGAIDAKSPYTGGHCERVPELATMLCRAASDLNEGPLAEFSFKTEEEWREFNIAGWLHDCGKVTTPEHVVDKATKLETINNRIHEVRTRFEVLLRDAQIERFEAIYERGESRESADDTYAARKRELIDDFEFIANCNVGGEFLDPEKVDRIHRIAKQTWARNFNNRIGLSEEELRRYPPLTSEELPVTEDLLSDRPEHIIERPPTKALDPKFGFKMDIPEHLYNHGELHNLAISRGTLTNEERFKINEHIIQTIAILEQMPFPANLKRVPEIAGAHHETLIGTGYPRKLTADELSVPARIMAIADIFEALTASDRPYKKAKTLSESIKILSFFKKDQHIDPVLFDLFLTEGIYKTYAERYLLPEQIDEVDIAQYVG